MSHHQELHEIPAWRRREVARNTGIKCERSQYSAGFKAARRADRARALKADTKRELREAGR